MKILICLAIVIFLIYGHTPAESITEGVKSMNTLAAMSTPYALAAVDAVKVQIAAVKADPTGHGITNTFPVSSEPVGTAFEQSTFRVISATSQEITTHCTVDAYHTVTCI